MGTIYFGTNRNLIETDRGPSFGKHFNVDGPHAVRFGSAEVTSDKFEDIQINVADEVLFTEAGQEITLGSKEIYKQIRHKMRKHSRDTLVYIHGYANTFESSLQRAAELKRNYSSVPLNVFVFCWPTDGEMIPLLSYYRDRDDARASGVAMARSFLKLKDFLGGDSPEEHCNQRLHLLAHSMGNYALRHAVQGIQSEIGVQVPRIFDNVFHMAADEDDDAFEHDHKLRLLPRMARAVHVYFNPEDRALLISDKTKRNPDRLGSDGPRLVDNLPKKVVLLDCRDVDVEEKDAQIHQYYRLSPEVIADVVEVLRGTPSDKIPGRHYMSASRSFRILRVQDRG